MKRVRFNLWEIEAESSSGEQNISELLSNILLNPIIRNVQVFNDGDPVGFHGSGVAHTGRGFIIGTISRVQMKEIPELFDTKKKVKSRIPLDEDQGLNHVSSFLFDPTLNILAFESTRIGPGSGAWAKIIEKADPTLRINLNHVLSRDGLAKLNKLRFIKEIEFTINAAAKQYLDIRKAEAKSLSNIINEFERTNYGRLSVVLKSDRGKYLDLSRIKKMAIDIFKTNTAEKILITGREDESEKKEPIDLIIDVARFHVEVESVRAMNDDFIQNKNVALEETYRHQQGEFRSLVKPRK